MKITLITRDEDGNEIKRDVYSRGISAGASLAAFDLMKEIEESGESESEGILAPGNRERMLRFIVDFFGGQFTEQEFLDGFEDSFFRAVPEMLRTVIAGVAAKVQEFPNVGTPEPAAREIRRGS